MKPNYTPLSQLDKPAKDVKVKVKVIQKSEPRQTPPKRSYQRLLLQDDEGTTMRGTIFGDDIKMYAEALKKHGEYELSGVSVRSVPDQYRSSGGEYQIGFNDKVKITPLDLSGCTDEPNYRHLSEVPRTHTDDDGLIDIVATIVHVGEVRTVTKGSAEEQVREILVADFSCVDARPMKLSAWNEHAVKEYSFFRSWPNSFTVIGATNLRPITFQGLTLRTMANTVFTDKPAGDKADAVKAWVQQNKPFLNNWRTKALSLTSAEKIPTPIECIVEKKASTLWQDEKFWIQAVLSQLADKDFYCYVGCITCGRSTTEDIGAKFACHGCRTTDSTASYRVSLNTVAVDATNSVKVATFTPEVELICNLKCADLVALKHNENPDPFAKFLEHIRKKEMLLQIAPTNALTISNILKWTIRQVEAPP